jgi:hypothetical protein
MAPVGRPSVLERNAEWTDWKTVGYALPWKIRLGLILHTIFCESRISYATAARNSNYCCVDLSRLE